MEKELSRQEQEETFIKILNETGKQSEAIKIVGWDKSKASRFVKKLREEEPERLRVTKEIKSEASTSQATQKPEKVPEPQEPIESITKVQNSQEKPNKKATMGFRADVDRIEFWRIFADVIDTEIGVLCTAAIDEYIKKYELAADQKEIIDIRLKALEAERKIRERGNI